MAMYFLSQIYDSRHKWAKPYFKEKFCAKQTSMQRNECADYLFKGYVPLNRSINMLVRHYNKLQSDLDSKESFEENRSRKVICPASPACWLPFFFSPLVSSDMKFFACRGPEL